MKTDLKFCPDINNTGESGILVVETNEVFCMCSENVSRKILSAFTKSEAFDDIFKINYDSNKKK